MPLVYQLTKIQTDRTTRGASKAAPLVLAIVRAIVRDIASIVDADPIPIGKAKKRCVRLAWRKGHSVV